MRSLLVGLISLCLAGSIFALADYNATVPVSGTPFGGTTDGTHQFTQVSGTTVTNAQTPTVTASTYAASVDMGGILTFPVLYSPRFTGVLQSITIKFKASVQTVGFFACVFTASPAGTFTDHSAAAIAAADSSLLVGCYHLTAVASPLGTHTIYNMDAIGKAIVGATANLFVVVVPDGATTALASTTDMIVELGMGEG